MEILEQTAFLLHSRPYRENQQLLEFLTETEGKVSAVTYIRQSKKINKQALLQPFIPLKISYKGINNLKNLMQVEAIGKPYAVKGNCLYSAFYLNELLVRLLGEQISCDLLFEHYQASLSALAAQQPIEIILRSFELVLLDELGLSLDFSPVFEHKNHRTFYYIAEQGFVPVLSRTTQPSFDAEHLKLIAEQNLSSQQVLQTFKMLMRQVMQHLLGNKPLNSRKLFIHI